MVSPKQLRGVAHDLAHHSQSGLSWMHPHLADACARAGHCEVTLELLEEDPYPAAFASVPLRLATVSLREWFLGLLTRLGNDSSAIARVTLTFKFRPGERYDSTVAVVISTAAGKAYSADVGFVSLK